MKALFIFFFFCSCAPDIVIERQKEEGKIKEEIKANPDKFDSLHNRSKKVWDF